MLRSNWNNFITPLPTPPKLKLSRLRDIGWSLWDPIGLLGPNRRWDEDEAQGFANEYDTYLVEAAGLLRRGISDQDVVELLVGAEMAHMGLGGQPDTYEHSRSTVAAIKADKDLWTYSE
ncbi:hypothetical protein [Rhizobium sp. BK376]|uniref:hypothetical protein n=1 Tax=Rhizobium sp. BK376 TaxID=2512149 RepID=UPI0010D7F7F0|nr:hypothetical protein [Rhizobium sp. BK376]TCR83663.1 hypothetical protein EV561_109195 [Rhizobium sp. BK376]